jgi:putative ABC transport system permease protein
LYTSLNVFGLALGLAAALIIGIFANHELTYDQYHENSESIFMAYKERITPNGVQATYDTWTPMGQRLVEEYPEVIKSVRFVNDDAIFEVNNERFEGNLSYSDTELFELFDFELELGNTDNPFPTENSIILSEAAATRYFGNENPLGQVVRIDLDRAYEVTGVLKSIPTNSSIQIEHLISLNTLPTYAELENDWGGSFLNTYIQLEDAHKAKDLVSKFPDLITSIWDEEVMSRTNFKLLPLKDVYSTIIGDIQIAYILLYIAVGILVISCINFINLYTSSALSRSKEIGVKKVVGSSKNQLLTQFLGEALLVVIISIMIALATTTMFMPVINNQFGLLLSVPFANPNLYRVLVSLVVIIGMLSGGYPAYVMSKFGIIASLKRSTTSGQGRRPLNFMIAFQFFVSILLIVGTLVVNKQIDFLQNNSMGFENRLLDSGC